MNTVLKRMTAILAAVTLLLGCVGCGTRDTAESDQPIVPKTESATEEISESPDWEGILTEDPAEGIDLTGLALPESSGEFSVELARQVLALCTGHTAQRETELLECAGFTVAAQVNYDKGDAISHTCAYTVGLKQVSFGGEERTLVLIAVRGTEGGEWYSNFDFAPSRSDEGQFAENFLFAAEDAFVGVQSVLASVREPLVLVCGHSRGGACANLLGMLLNAELGEENVLTYTFASPATFRGEDCGVECSNIFNVINSGDVVPRVPLGGWGYRRLGEDILLEGEDAAGQRADTWAAELLEIAPTVEQYYNERHSLTEPGLSDIGVTAFEMMLAIADAAVTGQESGRMNKGVLTMDNDFAPLLEMLRDVTEKDGALGYEVVREHMPAAYQKLLGEIGG